VQNEGEAPFSKTSELTRSLAEHFFRQFNELDTHSKEARSRARASKINRRSRDFSLQITPTSTLFYVVPALLELDDSHRFVSEKDVVNWVRNSLSRSDGRRVSLCLDACYEAKWADREDDSGELRVSDQVADHGVDSDGNPEDGERRNKRRRYRFTEDFWAKVRAYVSDAFRDVTGVPLAGDGTAWVVPALTIFDFMRFRQIPLGHLFIRRLSRKITVEANRLALVSNFLSRPDFRNHILMGLEWNSRTNGHAQRGVDLYAHVTGRSPLKPTSPRLVLERTIELCDSFERYGLIEFHVADLQIKFHDHAHRCFTEYYGAMKQAVEGMIADLERQCSRGSKS
jgi:hypothetical protein